MLGVCLLFLFSAAQSCRCDQLSNEQPRVLAEGPQVGPSVEVTVIRCQDPQQSGTSIAGASKGQHEGAGWVLGALSQEVVCS